MCIFTPWGILPRPLHRNHHRRKSTTTTTTTPSTSSPTYYAPRLVKIQPPKHHHSLTYPTTSKSIKPPSTNNRHHHPLTYPTTSKSKSLKPLSTNNNNNNNKNRRPFSPSTQPLLSHSPPLRTRTHTSPTYPSHQTRIRNLTSQLLQRQTLETRRDVLASLADRYHDVPQPSSSSSSPSPLSRAETKRMGRRRATIASPALSSVSSSESYSSSEGWSEDLGGFDGRGRGRGRGRRVAFSTPATSVSVSMGSAEGGGGVVGGGGAVGGNGGNGIGNGNVGGYGYNIPFVPAPQLPLFGAASSSSVSGSAGSGSEASTVSEYWVQGSGVGGGGWRYWNDSAQRRGVVDSWGEGRRGGAGVGYATMGGLREERERVERGLGRVEGGIGRARAGVGGYRLWTWE